MLEFISSNPALSALAMVSVIATTTAILAIRSSLRWRSLLKEWTHTNTAYCEENGSVSVRAALYQARCYIWDRFAQAHPLIAGYCVTVVGTITALYIWHVYIAATHSSMITATFAVVVVIALVALAALTLLVRHIRRSNEHWRYWQMKSVDYRTASHEHDNPKCPCVNCTKQRLYGFS